jgi:hypothetical protein
MRPKESSPTVVACYPVSANIWEDFLHTVRITQKRVYGKTRGELEVALKLYIEKFGNGRSP